MLSSINKSNKFTHRESILFNKGNKTFGSSKKDDVEYVKIPKKEYDRDNTLWTILALIETVSIIGLIFKGNSGLKFPK